MRIGMIAPLVEPLPPPLYGGTERVVASLTEELVRQGHDVTLFASGDSETSAKLVACSPRALRVDPTAPDLATATLFQLGQVYARAGEFEIIHNHADWYALPFASCFATPTVTTTHGRLDLPDLAYHFTQIPDQELVSLSLDQKTHLPNASWAGTVYNGIETSHFNFSPNGGEYLAFLGRLTPEKRPDLAVEIAHQTGRRLVIAAKLDKSDMDYYESIVLPILRDPQVEYVGEVDEQGKDELLRGAYAMLFPIDWPEPFGLAMVESMATGTPVIAMARGAVPEVVVDGKTGFICHSLEEMVSAVDRISSLDRLDCRIHVERFFSADRMAGDYLEIYEGILGKSEQYFEQLAA